MVRGIIFDMDGLLFNTEALYLSSSREILREMGYRLDEGVFRSTIGVNHKKTKEIYLEILGPEFSVDTWEKMVYRRVTLHFRENGVEKKPGADELLEALRERGYPLAVASSTNRADVTGLLKMGWLLEYFDALVCGDEITRSKPHPEIFLKAAEKIGVPPGECLVFEDSYAGLEGAAAAGMRPVMIPDQLPPRAEDRERAFRICGSLLEVRDSLDEFLA